MKETFKVLGIDPGLERVGFGFVEASLSSPLTEPIMALDWGIIKTSKKDHRLKRLGDIHSALTGLLDSMKPDAIAIEQLFFFRNITTMAPVSEARGVILLACYQYGSIPSEYTPLQIKQTITGSGKAQKDEIQTMVAALLKMDGIPQPDDAADALAIAMTDIFHQHANGYTASAEADIQQSVL